MVSYAKTTSRHPPLRLLIPADIQPVPTWHSSPLALWSGSNGPRHTRPPVSRPSSPSPACRAIAPTHWQHSCVCCTSSPPATQMTHCCYCLAGANHEQARVVWLPVSQSALSSIILIVPWPLPACTVTGKFTNAGLIFNLLPSHPAHILAYVIMMTAFDRTLLWADFFFIFFVGVLDSFVLFYFLRDGRVRVEYFFFFFVI